jgi:hypothetical protein
MQVLYIDEYGEDLYLAEDSHVPTVSDTITLDEEDWRVKSRTFVPQKNAVIIEVTQGPMKSKISEDIDEGRLNKMQHAILEVSNRQKLTEKRVKSLREQSMSIRQHIRRNTPKPKENI